MINIDENIINQLIENQVRGQISNKLEKYFKSKGFEDMVRAEARNILYNWNNINVIADNFIKEGIIKESVISKVADTIHNNIVNAIKYSDEY